MKEWKTYKLGDICSSISETYKSKSKSVVLINTSDVLEGRCLNHEFVPNKDLKGQFKKVFKFGDILYSEIRPANKRFAYIDFDATDYIASTKLMVLRNNDKVTNRFLYHYLKSESTIAELQALAESRSGTFPQITFSELSQLEISIPDIETQLAISSFIDTLESKIELNRQINDNLEKQAQALYKSWFIDFEPFKEDEFVETEVGMAPRGWRIGNLLDVAELYDSKRKPLSGMQRSTMKKIYPYYGATSIMDYVDNYIFDGTYLLMGEDGSVITDEGYPFLQYVSGKFWPNNHAHVMQGKNGFTTEMLHCFLLKKNISEIVTGAVQAKVSQGNMKKISLAIAPNEILSAFAQVLDGIYAKIRAIYSENQQLETMRDTLLPKLMSGELKINKTDC